MAREIEGTIRVEGQQERERDDGGRELSATIHVGGEAAALLRSAVEDRTVSLAPAAVRPTGDQILWTVIRNRTEAIRFDRYAEYMDRVMCLGPDLEPDAQDGEDEEALAVPEKEKGEYVAGRGYTGKEVRRLQKSRATVKTLHDGWNAIRFRGTDAFEILKDATEAFLMQECGILLKPRAADRFELMGFKDQPLREENRRRGSANTLQGLLEDLRDDYLVRLRGEKGRVLPYFNIIRNKLRELPLKGPDEVPPNCYGILRSEIEAPCMIELIWSYWHEQAMLVQAMKAISLRFQNVRSRRGADPLANLELDPLRPLNNLLWGYIQDEQQRLSVARRVYEYDHHYGLRLYGRAVPQLRPADSRTRFMEAFHNLLHRCAEFYERDDDTTVRADAFEVLNALREVHLLLTEGMHNQYGDLPWTARVEMMMEQWLLARPEMREFLRGRTMVAYPEAWMEPVDAMRSIQRWPDIPVIHFRDLGVFGEQILLSIRFGAWMDVNDPASAANWARYWRPEIQRYVHSYRAVTGVDLTADQMDVRMSVRQAASRLETENLRTIQPGIQIRRNQARNREQVQ